VAVADPIEQRAPLRRGRCEACAALVLVVALADGSAAAVDEREVVFPPLPCSACGGRARPGCPNCRGTGRVGEPPPRGELLVAVGEDGRARPHRVHPRGGLGQRPRWGEALHRPHRCSREGGAGC
jgi:hypothetical protein